MAFSPQFLHISKQKHESDPFNRRGRFVTLPPRGLLEQSGLANRLGLADRREAFFCGKEAGLFLFAPIGPYSRASSASGQRVGECLESAYCFYMEEWEPPDERSVLGFGIKQSKKAYRFGKPFCFAFRFASNIRSIQKPVFPKSL